MILDLLFVLPNLLLHLVQRQIKRDRRLISGLSRDQVMAMFGVYEDFNRLFPVVKIDRDPNRSDSPEIGQKFFDLLRHVIVSTLTDASVSAGDGNLHRR